MNFIDVMQSRRSIRKFKNQDVPEYLLEEILETALLAPSSSNTQAYRIAIASDRICNSIRQELVPKFKTLMEIKDLPLPIRAVKGLISGVLPDGDYNTQIAYPSELKKRSMDCAKGMYDTLGIDRHDRPARNQQAQRNFEFFDAPVAIFVFVHDKMGPYGALDAGIFLQSLMLAATSKGLGTCAQAALAIWGSPVRKHFAIEKDYKLICGLSLGYPDETHDVNQYRPNKRSLDELLLPVK